jgi:hypothetical protein
MLAYNKSVTIQRFAAIKGCSKANVYSNLYKFILARDEDNKIIRPYRVIMTEEAMLWSPQKKLPAENKNGVIVN